MGTLKITNGLVDAPIAVTDRRDGTVFTPAYMNRSISTIFSNASSPQSYWYSGITVKGWNDTYQTWQLVGNSDNTDTGQDLFYRYGREGPWGSWQRILSSSNYSSYALPLSGGTISGQLKSSYSSGTWLNAAQGGSAIWMNSTSFNGWIGGRTKNGGMTIATYPSLDDQMYIGYCASSTTANSLDNKWQFNGADGTFWSKTVSTNKLIVSTTSYGSSLPSETTSGALFFKLV